MEITWFLFHFSNFASCQGWSNFSTNSQIIRPVRPKISLAVQISELAVDYFVANALQTCINCLIIQLHILSNGAIIKREIEMLVKQIWHICSKVHSFILKAWRVTTILIYSSYQLRFSCARFRHNTNIIHVLKDSHVLDMEEFVINVIYY